MKNEVRCKFIAYNICVLIQSQIELGIDPVFWGEQAEATAQPIAQVVDHIVPAQISGTVVELNGKAQAKGLRYGICVGA